MLIVFRASTTRTVKLDEPCAAGVPLITPALLNASPDGKLPAARLHASGDTQPLLARVSEYANPTLPVGSGLLVVTAQLLGTVN